MNDNFSSQAVINNELDYSNIIPNIDPISELVKYCDQVYQELTKLVEEDEEKNKQFKTEYKEWNYKKSYGQLFEVIIREKNFNNIICKNHSQFISAVEGGNLNDINSLEIRLCMDFYRGKGDDTVEHENSFIISFKPYYITFIRKSNYDDSNMDRIEDEINSIFKSFSVANTIFCNKENQ